MTASIWNPSGTIVPAVDSESNLIPQVFTATASQTVFTLTAFAYVPASNSLLVMVNGVYQNITTDFTETDTTSFTLTSGCRVGDIVTALGFVGITPASQTVIDAAIVVCQAAVTAAAASAVSAAAAAVSAAASAAAAAAVITASISAIAVLTPAANKFPYFTSSSAAALADLTAFSRSVLDDANAGAWFTTLGISAFVQTLLDDTDASTFMTTLGFSTYFKTLIDDADAAAARTTLGIPAVIAFANAIAVANLVDGLGGFAGLGS